MSFIDRFKNLFNIFNKRDTTDLNFNSSVGTASYRRPDRPRFNYGNERSIIAAIYTRMSVDAAQIKISVSKTNENDQFMEKTNDTLNDILNDRANIDQTGRAFIQDAVASLLDEGVVGLVPIDCTKNIFRNKLYDNDFTSMRVAKITAWYPQHVRVQMYDERDANRKEVIVPKWNVAIIENPFYSIMNEPSSTLKRLSKKLVMLDVVDEQTSSGKLDIIIQLPYAIKSEARKAQAESRRSIIEEQLAGSKYGIAYIDGTEHITQLNRPAENNLLAQVEYLTTLLYSQLGITKEIMEGSATEEVMNNYYERTIEPIISAITNELTSKFITKTSKTQGRTVMSFQSPFKFVPTSKLPDIADKFVRNQILTPNEIRGIVGYKPADDPGADELKNPNINQSNNEEENTDEDWEAEMDKEFEEEGGEENQNE
jgi:hypothetical protein